MKTKKVKWAIAVFSLMIFYAGSYFVMSLGGRYEAEIYGVKVDASGNAKFAPKKLTKGPSWYPFDVYQTNGRLSAASIVYFPLLIFDRMFWHNKSYAQLEQQS